MKRRLPRKFKEVEILEVACCVVVPTDKADTFIQAVRKKLGEISIRRGGESSGRGRRYLLLSIHVPPLKKEQFYSLLRDFCKEHNLPLSEETLQ